ncbi:hypothetical protein, partial [Corynebacterium striatum]|uniref:hypothetical protein n=1 Tax=Corynebacterium striatum TaxID=43770 RepID=UPI0025504A16
PPEVNQSGGQIVVRALLYPAWHESFEEGQTGQLVVVALQVVAPLDCTNAWFVDDACQLVSQRVQE